MGDTTATAYTFDETMFRSLVSQLLPSGSSVHFHRHNGTITFSFGELDDFIAATIGASSANIPCEIFNTFEGKHARPRSIASCAMKLALAPGLDDERINWFFAEVALLRREDDALSEEAFATLFARLHAGGGSDMDAAP